jgi:murein DD-endopeptidase / murein LD-carboxypeptidase
MAHTSLQTYSRPGILFIIAGFLLLISCSKKIYPEKKSEAPNYKSTFHSTDSKELKTFLSQGSEKYLDMASLTADDLVSTARKYLGTPHCMGGSSKKCTDCSGLVMAVFAEHGIPFPHNSEEQARYGRIIRNKALLKKGDLVYFIKSYQTSKYITHTGIYLGNNEFIHTSSKKGVTITSLDNEWWKEKFIFGTRVLNN